MTRMRAPREPRRCAAALALGLMLGVAGCVDVEGELKADGSLSIRYTYQPPRHATFKSEHARLTSAHVRVENLERDRSLDGSEPGEFVTATLAVDDARQLSTAAAFAKVRIELDQAQGKLRVTLPGFDPATRERVRAAPEGVDRQALRVSLVLPGPVNDAEPHATIDARTVTWTFSTRQYDEAGDSVTLVASWGAKPAP